MSHPASCVDPSCELTYREHLLGIAVSASAIPSRRSFAMSKVTQERQWDRDMPAYKRLRANGLQPRQIDGSALVEKMATSESQVENAVVPSA